MELRPREGLKAALVTACLKVVLCAQGEAASLRHPGRARGTHAYLCPHNESGGHESLSEQTTPHQGSPHHGSVVNESDQEP